MLIKCAHIDNIRHLSLHMPAKLLFARAKHTAQDDRTNGLEYQSKSALTRDLW